MTQSSRPRRAPVKSGAHEQRPPGAAGAQGWSRHLEGWQPAAVAIFIAGSVAALVVPRPIEPADVPVPRVDPHALARVVEADAARAEALEPVSLGPRREGPARVTLDLDVRELGAAVRAFGLVDANPGRKDAELIAARTRLAEAVRPALAQGEEPVLALRAFQQRAFLREVCRWRATGKESDALRELGGDVLGLLRRSGWLEEGAGLRRVAAPDVALGVMFKKRWNAVVGIEGGPFEPALDEQRALYAFLIAHPIRDAAPATVPARDAPTAAARALSARRAEDQYRLKKIEEIAALDPSYPRDLARGVVLYRLERYLAAVEAFRRHLDASPEGPHTLRAQNYLRAALGRASD